MYPEYFDTLKENRADSRMRASSNNRKVLNFFRSHPGELFTPLEAHRLIDWGGHPPPESSTKRAVTTLTKNGYLTKTPVKKMEKYGENNFCWTYLPKVFQSSLFL